jgi:hypothetical protein
MSLARTPPLAEASNPVPPDALLRDESPPSVELHPSITPGTEFKRYDSRLIEGVTIASCLALGLVLLVLSR